MQIEDKVSNLENSLQSVTAEFRGVIQTFNACNAQTAPRLSDTHARDEVSNRQGFRRADRSPSYSSNDSGDGSSSGAATSNSHIRVNRGGGAEEIRNPQRNLKRVVQ